jgi:hypothetical protein
MALPEVTSTDVSKPEGICLDFLKSFEEIKAGLNPSRNIYTPNKATVLNSLKHHFPTVN